MLRVLHEHDPAPRLPDGRLWCGHPESSIRVDENGCHVCHVCTFTSFIPRVGASVVAQARAYEDREAS